MKKVTYAGAINKKPIKESVFVEDSIIPPASIKHPKTGVTLTRVGRVSETEEEPKSGSLLIREYSTEELDSVASKEADAIIKELEENPNSYGDIKELKRLPREHWLEEVKRVYSLYGKLIQV